MTADGDAGDGRPGTILGTIHYMAPEQVEGREADTRSDIWALGAVLYEMATGTRPFDGASAASVIGAILKDTPPAVSARQPLAPSALDHLVARCLAKDADERWQDAGDVKGELSVDRGRWNGGRACWRAHAQPVARSRRVDHGRRRRAARALHRPASGIRAGNGRCGPIDHPPSGQDRVYRSACSFTSAYRSWPYPQMAGPSCLPRPLPARDPPSGFDRWTP